MLFKKKEVVPLEELVGFFSGLDEDTIYNYGRWSFEEHKEGGRKLVSKIIRDPLEFGVVAIEDEEVVGYGHLNLFEKFSRRYQASIGLVIHQDYQRAGRGTALLRYLLVDARLRGLKKVWAHIHEDNTGSLSLFLRKFKFEKEGLFRDDEWFNNDKPISVISVAKFIENE